MPDHRPPADGGDALEGRLRTLAHALVAEAPEPPAYADLHAAPPASADAGRGRRPLLVAAAVAAVLAAGGGAVAVVGGGDDGAPPVEFVAGLGPDAPGPQRLLFEADRLELLDDGTLAPLPDAGLDSSEAEWMPDGRTIALGVVDTTPRPGVDDDTVPFVLRVADADGRVLLERSWEGGDRPARLLGATQDTAVLLRDGDPPVAEEPDPEAERIVVHDLATGDERVVGDTTVPVAWAEAYGDRLVAAGPGVYSGGPDAEPGTCGVEVVSLTDGTSTMHPLPDRCQEVRGIRLTPDGRRAAVTYGLAPAAMALPEVWVAVVDLTTSTVVADQLLGHDLVCEPDPCAGATPRSYLGMAWDDGATLRVALLDLARQPDRWSSPDATVDPDAVVVERLTVP